MEYKSHYLSQYFLSWDDIIKFSGVSEEFLNLAIKNSLIPGHSYTITTQQTYESHIFGVSKEEKTTTKFFHKSTLSWIKNASQLLLAHENDFKAAGENFEQQMKSHYKSFLVSQQASSEEDAEERWNNTWSHFLKGTYGVCVLKPDSIEEIARKQQAVTSLINFTENGSKTQFTESEVIRFEEMVENYNKLTMPFAPWDYHLSSRKRVVDNIKKVIEKN